jgi:ribosome-associated heat shock protein Hsp15
MPTSKVVLLGRVKGEVVNICATSPIFPVRYRERCLAVHQQLQRTSKLKAVTDAEDSMDNQRLDKWLWVARFYKTRSVAAEAVSGGKVHVDGQRVKPAKLIRVGVGLEIRRGDTVFEVMVDGLHLQRRPAPEAALLYTETEQSATKRAEEATQRAMATERRAERTGRPTKRDRRRLSEMRDL